MDMKSAAMLLVLLIMIAPAQAGGQWEKWDDVSAYTLQYERGGHLVSTDVISYPNSTAALIMYFDAGGDLFRCVETVDPAFRVKGQICFKLIKPD